MTIVLTACLVAGFIFILIGRTAASTGDFYGGRYPATVMAVALVATYTGGGALFGISGLTRQYGYWAILDCVASVAGLMVTSVFIMRGTFGKTYARDFFNPESRLSNPKFLATHHISITVLFILVIAAQLKAADQLAVQIGIPGWIGVVACSVFVAAYASNGFAATTRTDVWQVVSMVPLYVILAAASLGELQLPQQAVPSQSGPEIMPWPLAVILLTPLLYIPLSQELTQRTSSAGSDRDAIRCNLIAAGLIAILGGTLVASFANNPSISLKSLLTAPGFVVPVLVAIGIMSALLSTIDTAANLASKSFGMLPVFRKASPTQRAWLAIAIGAALYSFFPTVLSLIYVAIFIYLSGPAMGFLAIRLGLLPSTAAFICGVFIFAQFSLATDTALARWMINTAFEKPIDSSVLGLGIAILELLTVLLLWAVQRTRN